MLLRGHRLSLSEIARSLGVGLPMVSRVNKGERRSQPIEREIARRLMLTVAQAFPEWRDDQPRRTPKKPAKP